MKLLVLLIVVLYYGVESRAEVVLNSTDTDRTHSERGEMLCRHKGACEVRTLLFSLPLSLSLSLCVCVSSREVLHVCMYAFMYVCVCVTPPPLSASLCLSLSD